MNKTKKQDLLRLAIKAAVEAGEEIMNVYSTEFEVETKEDNSPLTLADKNAHECIVDVLGLSDIPVLSEEGKETPYKERKKWNYFWLVDPLDGTKEFVKKNGEFTVNIALIRENTPVMGVIYVPVSKTVYFAAAGLGAYKFEGELNEDILKNATALPFKEKRSDYTVIASRTHSSPETQALIKEIENKHDSVELLTAGSALKFCLLAEGAADIYPRFAPTMEWDSAAGHSIVNEIGGVVIDYTTKEEMTYNKENLLNNWFTAFLKKN